MTVQMSWFANIQLQQPYDDHVIESADKHQQKAAHEGKKLEMDNSNSKDLFSTWWGLGLNRL